MSAVLQRSVIDRPCINGYVTIKQSCRMNGGDIQNTSAPLMVETNVQ